MNFTYTQKGYLNVDKSSGKYFNRLIPLTTHSDLFSPSKVPQVTTQSPLRHVPWRHVQPAKMKNIVTFIKLNLKHLNMAVSSQEVTYMSFYYQKCRSSRSCGGSTLARSFPCCSLNVWGFALLTGYRENLSPLSLQKQCY